MKYLLPTKATGYFPEVLATLHGLDDEILHNDFLGLSHPSDIFLTAFSDVIDCTYRIAKRVERETELRRGNVTYNVSDLDEIRIDVFNLLFFAANFIEACQSIVKSLFPKGDKDKNFTKAAREFKDLTATYRGHVSKIINEIKHKHRRISPFTYTWDNNLIVGYYVEGLVERNVLGPDPLMHPDFNGLKTAFSLNRDIKYHLVSLYFVSACLSSIVKKYSKMSDRVLKVPDCSKIIHCLSTVAIMPASFFPDEIEKAVPAVYSKNNGESFVLEFPSRIPITNKYLHIANITATGRMGLRNRGFAPPYFGGEGHR